MHPARLAQACFVLLPQKGVFIKTNEHLNHPRKLLTTRLLPVRLERPQLLNSSIMKEIPTKEVIVCNCFCNFITQDLVFW
jgi:hypothetical protein